MVEVESEVHDGHGHRGAELGALVVRLRAAGCVFAEEEARILHETATSPEVLTDLVARRESGEPLEHLVGWAEVYGRRILVEPGVFVPRRRTELLVREALRLLVPGSVVVELCCGTGAIASVLSSRVERLHVHAVDIDPAAVRCARRNLGPPATVYLGDLFDALPRALRGAVDLVVANAPYVPTPDIRLLPPEARLHEPPAALDGGWDGLDVLRRVIEGAPGWLARGGSVLVEASARQADTLVAAMAHVGLDAGCEEDEHLGATVVIGTAAPSE